MNKYLAGLLLFLFLVQFSLLPPFGIGLNLMLGFSLVLAQKRFEFSGMAWIAVAGFLVEIFSTGAPGAILLAFCLLALAMRAVHSFFAAFESSRLISCVIYAGSYLLFVFLVYYLNKAADFLGIPAASSQRMANLVSADFWQELAIFAIATCVMLIIYEKLEKISGEKDNRLVIENN